jgi:hypothetical protein
LRRTLLKVVGAAALACVVVPLATAAHAEVPAAHTAAKPKPNSEGNGAGGAATGKHHNSSGSGAQSGSDEAGLATNIVHDVHGGYVASGVGLRNRGSGNIVLSGIPARATVTKAYLYWNILGGSTPGSNFSVGRIGRTQIRGAFLGQGDSPCWGGVTTGYAYRADVTGLVGGNGTYALSGFASGQTNGADPFTTGSTPPLAEGASLVVVYSKPSYPLTRVLIANGYSMTSGTTFTENIGWGFPATNPVGQVRTTFIGGDGQANFTEPASTFNGTPIAQADWDGTDRPIPPYSQGNLWDTDTATVGTLVHPGQTSANVTVTGGGDCLTWVAQVLSIARSGAVDSDGDKLLDGWEANGYDADGNGSIDVNLPAFGASPVHKDLFVEMDYMGDGAPCNCLPQAAELSRIVNVFASAPQANNPDGLTGIRLHLDAGPARPGFNLGGGNLVPFDADLNPVLPQFNAIRATNYNPLRAKIFYYMIWANGYDGGTSSGNAFAIPNDQFVVTLGFFPSQGTPDAKVGTFIHEFGHDLGLLHGGDENKNYKPNFLSVMSYAHQINGIPRTGVLAPYFGYSAVDLPNLVEGSLNENVGLNSAAANIFRTRWFCPNGTLVTGPTTANGPTNWNCNGATGGTVSADINGDGVLNTLTSHNDWGNLVYGGGQVGAGLGVGAAESHPMPRELTPREAARTH